MARIMLASMAKRLQSKVQDITMLSLQSATQRIVAYVLGAVRDDDRPGRPRRPEPGGSIEFRPSSRCWHPGWA